MCVRVKFNPVTGQVVTVETGADDVSTGGCITRADSSAALRDRLPAYGVLLAVTDANISTAGRPC